MVCYFPGGAEGLCGVDGAREGEVGFDEFLDFGADGSVLELEGGVAVTSLSVGEFEDEVVFYQPVEFFLGDVEVLADCGGGVQVADGVKDGVVGFGFVLVFEGVSCGGGFEIEGYREVFSSVISSSPEETRKSM